MVICSTLSPAATWCPKSSSDSAIASYKSKQTTYLHNDVLALKGKAGHSLGHGFAEALGTNVTTEIIGNV
jgi:hypothetical protein